MKLFFSDYSKEAQNDILVMIGESAENCTDLCTFKMFDFSNKDKEDIAWRLQMFDDAWKFISEPIVRNLLSVLAMRETNITPAEILKDLGWQEIPIKIYGSLQK